MASTTFTISDTHFGHKGICEFVTHDNKPVRPWNTPEEMDEEMTQLWNETVKPEDKVYHLGDVVINRRHLSILSKLNGRKILIKGNHDLFKLPDYLTHFKDIRAYHVVSNVIMSHIPLHPLSKGRFRGNIHGHTHTNVIPDPWYQCVCVEQIGYKPIPLDEVLARYTAMEAEAFVRGQEDAEGFR